MQHREANADSNAPKVGEILRAARGRRRLSQLDLASTAGISTRHLSYLETGRARPSREMLARLSDVLDLTLRERNRLLLAADYAPAYRETPLDEPSMAAVRDAVDMMLASHEPFPAVAIDRAWNIVAANRGMQVLMASSPPELSSPVPNVFRLVLHPDGLLSHLTNADQVRAHMLDQLRRHLEVTGDAALRRVYEEVEAYPAPDATSMASELLPESPIQVPLRIRTPFGELTLFSTMTTFGTPADVTVDELALEFFYPLDASTDRILRRLADEDELTA